MEEAQGDEGVVPVGGVDEGVAPASDRTLASGIAAGAISDEDFVVVDDAAAAPGEFDGLAHVGTLRDFGGLEADDKEGMFAIHAGGVPSFARVQ